MKPLDSWLDQKLQENGGGRGNFNQSLDYICNLFYLIKITDWYRRFNNFKSKHPHLKVLLAVGELYN
jgi:hypothetical protein